MFRQHTDLVTAVLTLFSCAVASYLPSYSLWGINHLAYLPSYWWLVLGACFVVTVLSAGWPRFAASVSHAVNETNQTLWCRGQLVPAIIVVFSACLFYVFRSETHFLGDGYTWLSNIGRAEMLKPKWAEFSSFFLVRAIQQAIGDFSVSGCRTAFQVISITSGVIAVTASFGISNRLATSIGGKTQVLAAMLFSGSVVLYFGYVEFYPASWATSLLFIYASLWSLHFRKVPWLAAVILAVSATVHVQILYFVPALAHLFVCRIADPRWRRRAYGVLATSGAIAIGAGIAVAYQRPEIGRLFLPLIEGRPSAPDYTLLSLQHFLDILQVCLIVIPGILPLLFRLRIKEFRSLSREAVFLIWCSAGSLTFLMTYGAAITMARDWDIMSLTLLGPLLLLAHLSANGKRSIQGQTLLSFALVSLFITGAFVAANTAREPSERRFRSLLSNRDRSSWIVLARYHAERGDTTECGRVTAQMYDAFPYCAKLDMVSALTSNGRAEDALILLRQLVQYDPQNIDFLHAAARTFEALGQFDSSEVYYLRLLRFRPYSSTLRQEIGDIYLLQGRYEDALSELSAACQLTPGDFRLVERLGLAYLHMGLIDSTQSLADGLLTRNQNSSEGHVLAFLAAAARQETAVAKEHYRMFLRYGQDRPDFDIIKNKYQILEEAD